ncbi:hypothetical protein ACOSP7_015615 [Xanthoceras sorbifolium]
MFEESVSIWASMNSWFTPTVLFVFLNIMIGTILVTSSLATHKPSEQQKPQDPQQPQHHQHDTSPSVLQRLKSINFYSPRSQEPTSIFAQNPALHTHFTSHYTHQHEQEQHQQQQSPQLTRSPSMLQRLKSINLYNYLSPEPTTSIHKTQEENTHYSPQQERHEEPTEEAEAEQEEEVNEEDDEHIQDQEQTLDEIYGQLTDSHVSRTKSDTKPASGEIPEKLPKKMKKSASSKSAFSHFEERDVIEARRPATVKESKARAKEMDDDEVDAKADDFINKFKHQLKLQRIDSILRYKETINRRTG